MGSFCHFLHNEEAATAVEYAVMLAMIVMACVGAISLIGGQSAGSWNDTSGKLQGALNP